MKLFFLKKKHFEGLVIFVTISLIYFTAFICHKIFRGQPFSWVLIARKGK